MLLGVLINTCCACSANKTTPNNRSNTYYTNPVFEPILADPTVIRDLKTGLFYAYGTQDNWGDGKGDRLMPILRSADLVDWHYVGNVFHQRPDWKKNGGLWAPDINFLNGKYYLYYSCSTWGDANPGIGLAIADSPEGPFSDQGKLFTSYDIDVPNSIDPSLFKEEDDNFLIWGSFGDGATQGIHLVQLDSEGKKLAPGAKKRQLAAGDWEAAMLHKKDGYYYFFGSKGSCCEGADSRYEVRVARSKNILGPYIDKEGNAITNRGHGSLLLQGNEKVAGPGHHTKIIQDDGGEEWLMYHGIWKDNPKVSSGASRRTLMLDKLVWEKGWPKIQQATASIAPQESPKIKRYDYEL